MKLTLSSHCMQTHNIAFHKSRVQHNYNCLINTIPITNNTSDGVACSRIQSFISVAYE